MWNVRIVALLAALITPAICLAQSPPGNYPDKPVKIIVPFAPAGPTDVVARLIAGKLSERSGKQFYIENVVGAGGNTGMGQAARAAPDGYTILFVSSSYVVNPSLYPKVPYDPYKDFLPVTVAGDAPNILLVHPSVPAKTVAELIDYIKANPGKVSYASAGTGTTPHLSGELFRLSQKLDIVHVPFSGAGPAIQSIAGGHTPMAFTSLPPAIPLIQDGKIRPLAVSAAKRVATLPNVPTLAAAPSMARRVTGSTIFTLPPSVTARQRAAAPSILMFASWITLPHFAISVLICAANSSGVLVTGSRPSTSKRSLMSGSATIALISR